MALGADSVGGRLGSVHKQKYLGMAYTEKPGDQG